jgi:hypothetical protein
VPETYLQCLHFWAQRPTQRDLELASEAYHSSLLRNNAYLRPLWASHMESRSPDLGQGVSLSLPDKNSVLCSDVSLSSKLESLWMLFTLFEIQHNRGDNCSYFTGLWVWLKWGQGCKFWSHCANQWAMRFGSFKAITYLTPQPHFPSIETFRSPSALLYRVVGTIRPSAGCKMGNRYIVEISTASRTGLIEESFLPHL